MMTSRAEERRGEKRSEEGDDKWGRLYVSGERINRGILVYTVIWTPARGSEGIKYV